jgi:hypothetical protein
MPLASTTIAIQKSTFGRFFRAYPEGKRSQIIQGLIEKDLESRQERLALAAENVESDPSFQAVRDDRLRERATAGDGLGGV